MNREPAERLQTALALVFDRSAHKVLTVSARDGQNPTLPSARLPARFYPEVEDFARAMSEICGGRVVALRCLDRGDAAGGAPSVRSALLLDADGSGYAPPAGFCWLDADYLDGVACLPAPSRAAVIAERDRLGREPPAEPPVAWEYASGWHERAFAWIAESFPRRSPSDKLGIRQIRAWSISTVYRVDGGGRRAYFKASPAFFPCEAGVAAAVAERFPAASARILAADPAAGWTLCDDLGDATLADANDERLWIDAMRSLARIQRWSADNPDALARLGLERRTTAEMLATLERWTAAPQSLDLRYSGERAANALRRIEPRLALVRELCAELDALALPPALDHGDLDGGNMFARDGSATLMDWSDACVSNPLFTPALIRQVERNPAIADAFLREWADFAPLERLRAVFESAKTLAALERAIHYRDNITPYLARPSVDLRCLEAYIPDLLELAAARLERRASL